MSDTKGPLMWRAGPIAPKKKLSPPPSTKEGGTPKAFSRAQPLAEERASASSNGSFMGGRVIRRARKNPKTGEWEDIDDKGNVLPKRKEPPNPNSTSVLPNDPRWGNASGNKAAGSSKKKRVRLPALVPPSKKPKVAPYDPLKKPPRQAPATSPGNSNPILNLPNLPKKKGKVVIGGNKASVPTPPNKRANPGQILPGPGAKDAYKNKAAGSGSAKRDTIPATPGSKAKRAASGKKDNWNPHSKPGTIKDDDKWNPNKPKGKSKDDDWDPFKFLDDDKDYAWEQGLPALRAPPFEMGSGEPTLTASAKDFGLTSKGERSAEHKDGGEWRPLTKVGKQEMEEAEERRKDAQKQGPKRKLRRRQQYVDGKWVEVTEEKDSKENGGKDKRKSAGNQPQPLKPYPSRPSGKTAPPPPPAQKPKTSPHIPAPPKKSTDAADKSKDGAASPKDAKASKGGKGGVKNDSDEEPSDEELDEYYMGMF